MPDLFENTPTPFMLLFYGLGFLMAVLHLAYYLNKKKYLELGIALVFYIVMAVVSATQQGIFNYVSEQMEYASENSDYDSSDGEGGY